jgi:hypothetical protein
VPTLLGEWTPPKPRIGDLPAAKGSIRIDDVGTFKFDAGEVKTVPPDVFQPGHFSLFGILVHLGVHGVRVLWVDIHKWGGLALGIGVLGHVALHWKWLLRMTRRYLGFGPLRDREPQTRTGEVLVGTSGVPGGSRSNSPGLNCRKRADNPSTKGSEALGSQLPKVPGGRSKVP